MENESGGVVGGTGGGGSSRWNPPGISLGDSYGDYGVRGMLLERRLNAGDFLSPSASIFLSLYLSLTHSFFCTCSDRAPRVFMNVGPLRRATAVETGPYI